jgi:hypothetical protein
MTLAPRRPLWAHRFLRPARHALPCALALTAGLWLASPAHAAVRPADFAVQRSLQPPPTRSAEVARFYLDAAVFAGADADFADLRLFDERDAETPFFIRRSIPVHSVTRRVALPVPAAVVAFREIPTNRIELTAQRAPKAPLASEIRFESSLRNFEKLVTVHGQAAGSTEWELLAAGEPIYDYTRFVDVRRDTVPIKAGPYVTYRIEIANITEHKDSPLVEIIRQTRGGDRETETTSFRREPFRLERVVFIESREETTTAPNEAETAEFALQPVSVTQDDTRRRTVVTFEPGRRPITAVTIVTDDANFSRQATLEGRGIGEDGTWRLLAEGRLTRVRAGRIRQDLLTLPLAETRCSSLRLIIDNQDNPPVVIPELRLREIRYEALFFPKTGRDYRLAQGARGLKAPEYDVAAVLMPVPSEAAGLWTLSDIGFSEPATVARAWWRPGGRTMLVAVLVIMAAVLAVIVARLARHIDAKAP